MVDFIILIPVFHIIKVNQIDELNCNILEHLGLIVSASAISRDRGLWSA